MIELVNKKIGRGRPRKAKLSDDEKFEEILFKAYNFFIDSNGQLKIERNGKCLTLEETAFMISKMEGKQNQMSNITVLNTEKSALNKLRIGLKKYNLNKLDDVFEPKYRTSARNIHDGQN